MAGFQLWVNLAAQDKMQPPAYRDVPPDQVPQYTLAGGVSGVSGDAHVRVIAGHSHGVAGAVTRPITEPLFLDLTLPAGASFAQPLPAAHNAFLYVFGGEVLVHGETVGSERMAILSTEAGADGVTLTALDAGARVLLMAGQPLNEPIVQHGPFVMNTADEIRQAVADFQRGVLAV